MKSYFRCLPLVLTALMSLMSIAVGCGDDHTGGAGGGDLAALEGVWFGFGPFGGNVSLIIDDSGNLTGSLNGGVPTGLTGSFRQLDDEIFSFVPAAGPESFFLTDETFEHGLFTAGIALMAVQKNPSVEPEAFAINDVVGSWSGYGYAFNDVVGAYEKVAPVQAVAFLLVPSPTRTFEVTLPEGATIDGTINTFDAETGIWGADTSTGGLAMMGMTVDKEFVAVWAGSPPTSASQELTFFVLNKN